MNTPTARASRVRTGRHATAGFSMVEMMVSLVVVGTVSVGVAHILADIGNLHYSVRQTVSGTFDRNLGARSIQKLISSAQVMRSGLISCTGASVMMSGASTQTLNFNAAGQRFSLVSGLKRDFGVSSDDADNFVRVTDTSLYYPGALLWVRNLRNKDEQGLFEVANVYPAAGELKLAKSIGPIDAFWACRPDKALPKITFNRDRSIKVSIEVLTLAQFDLVPDEATPGTLKMRVFTGPDPRHLLKNAPAPGQLLSEGIRSWSVVQSFTGTGVSSGSYAFSSNLTFDAASLRSPASGGRDPRENLIMSAGFRLTALDVVSALGVPEPPILNELYATCAMSATEVRNTYRREGSAVFTTAYLVSATFSEASKLVGAQAPAIAVTMTPGNPAATTTPPVCWADEDVESDDQGVRTLIGPGSTSKFSLAPSASSSSSTTELVAPLHCIVPNAMNELGTMQYTEFGPGGARNHSVPCTPTQIEGSFRPWKYSDQASTCNEDGTISPGRLETSTGAFMSGPTLRPADQGCTWSGTSNTSCNPFDVLSVTPSARLQKVQLTPANTPIENNSTLITCGS